jgi:predicted metal-dependent phosphoesterase TrpH
VRIDLHTHSLRSDGTDTPGELVAKAKEAGLDVVGLTDHDTTSGWDEASASALADGIALVRGAEYSARSGGITVHMLSYLHDPSYPPLVEEVDRVRAARDERAHIMVDRLSQDYPITWADVEAQTGDGATVGRPHIADALVAAGVVPDRSAAFVDLLHPRSAYYVRHYGVDGPRIVELIKAAGGVSVFAHPGAVERQRLVDDAGIAAMVEAGLDGLEVYHRDNPPEQRERLLGLAERYGLLVTGSSDYHGTGKPNRLGENVTSEDVYAEIVARGALPIVSAA